ncbi:hypothetical protein PQX77_000398 [Marasmius sp. AFHP31]|nr:hypothetical protein PQX77_000398 [Marasmius sp. AFHP31]
MSHSPSVDHVQLPPAYEPISDNEDAQTSTSSPPRYSRRPLSGCSTVHIQTSVKEFIYSHETVTLTINGDASLSEEIPTIVEGGKISGSVRLCWSKGQKVRDVTVSVSFPPSFFVGSLKMVNSGQRKNSHRDQETQSQRCLYLPQPARRAVDEVYGTPLPYE